MWSASSRHSDDKKRGRSNYLFESIIPPSSSFRFRIEWNEPGFIPFNVSPQSRIEAGGRRSVDGGLVQKMILAVAIALSTFASAGELERAVSGHTVSSSADPQVLIRLPDDASYVGADRFTLAKPGIGDFDACELFAFANADQTGSLRQVYWVQFEHYLPGHPELHYDYDSPRHVTIGGLDFYVDINASDGSSKPKPGSDGEHFYNLLAAHGYKRAPMMFVRLVHLPDAARRKELMIIAGKSLPAGMTAASLMPGGSDAARWPALQDDLVAWATHNIVIARSH